jgi:hypothetical protein
MPSYHSSHNVSIVWEKGNQIYTSDFFSGVEFERTLFGINDSPSDSETNYTEYFHIFFSSLPSLWPKGSKDGEMS